MANERGYMPVYVGNDNSENLKEFLIGPKVHVGNGFFENRFIIRTKDDRCVSGHLSTARLLEVLLPLVDADQLKRALAELKR